MTTEVDHMSLVWNIGEDRKEKGADRMKEKKNESERMYD